MERRIKNFLALFLCFAMLCGDGAAVAIAQSLQTERTDLRSEAETQSESQSETAAQSVSEPQGSSETEPQSQPQTAEESEAAPQLKPETVPESEKLGETEKMPESEKEGEKESQPESQRQTETAAQTEAQSETNPQTETEKKEENEKKKKARITASGTQTLYEAANGSGELRTFVKYQISVENSGNDKKEKLSVDGTLSRYLTYTPAPDETAGASVTDSDGAGWKVSWKNQTLSPSDTRQYVIYAEVDNNMTDLSAIASIWKIDGEEIAVEWMNQDILGNNRNKTEFFYSDAEVSVRAFADPLAGFPRNTQLKVEPIPEGSEAYEAAAAAADGQLGVPDGTKSAYILYDIYFEADGKRIEPRSGTVDISMSFSNPVFGDLEGEAAEYSVVHISEERGAEDVTDYIGTTQDGAVNSVGFRADRFSPFGLRAVVRSNPAETSTDLENFGLHVEIVTSGGTGDEGDPVSNNSWLTMDMTFEENSRYQFPVGKEMVYQMPDEVRAYITFIEVEEGSIEYENPATGETEPWGTYTIDSQGKVTIVFSEKVDEVYNGSADLHFTARFDKTQIGSTEEIAFTLPGSGEKVIYFKMGSPLTVRKEASQYDKDTGTFTFTITMEADTDADAADVIIRDAMGSSLELISGSVRIDGKTPPNVTENSSLDGFTMAVGTVEKGTARTITYQAKIKEEVIDSVNGVIPGLDNSVTVKTDGFDEFTISGPASYSHIWVRKQASEIGEDGRIWWTLSANPAADQDMSGAVVSDALRTSGIYYDTTAPISVTSDSGAVSFELQWSDVEMSADGRSWTYTMPEDAGKHSYVFRYATTVESLEVPKTYRNDGTVKGATSSASVTVEPGEAQTEYVGVGKQAKTVETGQNGAKYVKWSTTLTIPAEGASGVLYQDTLYGAQRFETLTLGSEEGYDKITITGYSPQKIKLTQTETAFTLDFGDIEGTGQEFDIGISYYSKVLANGTISNIGSITSNGKMTSSSDSQNIQDTSFTKRGYYDSGSQEIVWTVTLNDGSFDLGLQEITVTDTYSQGQRYVEGSAMVYLGNSSLPVEPEQSGSTLTFSLGRLPGKEVIYLEYKTKLTSTDVVYDSARYRNEAQIAAGGQQIGTAGAVVEVPSNVLDKTQILNPTSENGYLASYQVIVNESGMTLHEDSREFKIYDTVQENMEIQFETIVLEQGSGNGQYTVMKDGYTKGLSGNTLTVTIPDGDGHAYRLTYDVKISKRTEDPIEDVDYSNTVKFEVNGVTYTDTTQDIVEISQDSHGGIEGSKIYLQLFKFDSSDGKPLSGVAFELYEGNPEEGGAKIQEGVTDGQGRLYLGQNPKDSSAPDVQLKEGVAYYLTEAKALEGYVEEENKVKKIFQMDLGEDGKLDGIEELSNGDSIYLFNTPSTSKTVTKVWEDQNDQDGIRPDKIQVQLYRTVDSRTDPVGSPVTLQPDASGVWSGYTWENLPLFEQEKEITYSVKEVKTPQGYTEKHAEDENGNFVITNTHKPDTVEKTVTKIWDDAGNQDGKRPESVQVQLLADGKKYGEPVTLNSENGWAHRWTELPKYTDGQEILYTAEELTKIEGYTAQYSPDTFTITNTHIPETTKLSVQKRWNDRDNEDGNRPDQITVWLYRTVGSKEAQKIEEVTLTQSGGVWSEKTWENLPSYVKGEPAVYTVKEEDIAHYTAEYDYTTAPGTVIITNTYHRPQTDITVEKKWDDDDNRDGYRPAEIKVSLYEAENGTPAIYADGTKAETVILSEEQGWAHTWHSLLKTRDGQDILYTAKEEAVYTPQKEYTLTQTKEGDVITLTNTLESETIDVTVQKEWDDNQNEDGNRPETVTVRLYETIGGKKTEVEGKSPVTLRADQQKEWSYTWENLPRKSDGADIVYEVEEEEIEDYTAEYQDNAVSGADGTITVTNRYTRPLTQRSVQKIWNDHDNQDGARPETVEVALYRGTPQDKIQVGETLTLSQSNGWQGKWTDLAAKENGEEIVYFVEETSALPEGYAVSYGCDADDPKKLTVTNSRGIELTDVTVHKIWDDGKNQDGKRPASVKMQLFVQAYDAQGNLSDPVPAGGPVTIQGTGETWSYTWKNLEKNKDGRELVYTAKEIEIPDGYEASYSDDHLTVTNSYTPQQTDIAVAKIWDDADNQDGKRPKEITVTLKADGVPVSTPDDGSAGTVTLNGDNQWSHVWEQLPVYRKGKRIDYTLEEGTEAKENGYGDPEIETIREGETVTGFTVTNRIVPETTEKTVQKIWEDDENRDGLRSASVWVQLYADGKAQGKKAELNADNGWSYTWEELDRYRDGKAVAYTVDEVDENGNPYVPSGYKKEVDGFVITNTHERAEKSIRVDKIWDDGLNQDGVRPGEVEVSLYADGAWIDTVSLSEENSWSHQWDALAENDQGEKIHYTLTEEPVSQYRTQISDLTYDEETDTFVFNVTNIHTPDVTSRSVFKVWNDNDNQDGIRPDEVRVQLLADGAAYGKEVILSEANGWTYTWEQLPANQNEGAGSERIDYAIREIGSIEGYTVSCEELLGERGFVVVNTHETEKISKTLVKVWEDGEDAGRPDHVSFQLYANKKDEQGNLQRVPQGEAVTFTGEGDIWAYTWTGLDKMANGEEIIYEVEEIGVPNGYHAVISANSYLFTASNVKTHVLVSKQDLTGSREIPGAVLQITDQENRIVEEWVSQSTPYEITGVLKPGETYTLVEKKAPEGYRSAEPVVFTVSSDGSTDHVAIKDAPIEVTVSKKDKETGEELPGALLQILRQNGDGWTVAETVYGETLEWVSQESPKVIKGLAAGDYILREIKAPDGYLTAEDVLFTVKDGRNAKNFVQMEDERYDGAIRVTKKVYYLGNQIIEGDPLTFYCALFTDPGLTKMYVPQGEATSVRELKMEDVQQATAIYERLPYGTYYVAETDAEGNPVETMEYTLQDGTKVTVSASVIGGTISLTRENPDGQAEIHNEFEMPPEEFGYLDKGRVTVTKLVTLQGKPHEVTETFYCALFFDEERKIRATDVAAFAMEQDAQAEVTFERLPEGEYYLAETDQDGNPIEGEDGSFPYTIVTAEGPILVESDTTKYAQIENQIKQEPEAEETEPETEPAMEESESETEPVTEETEESESETGETEPAMEETEPETDETEPVTEETEPETDETEPPGEIHPAPSEPGPGQTNPPGQEVKTGDETDMTGYLALLAGAGAVIGGITAAGRRRQKKKDRTQ